MAAMSGVKAIAAAGTALQLGTVNIDAPLMVKALTTNTGLMYVGNDGAGDVASGNGMPLAAGDAIVFNYVGNLDTIWVDSAVNGESVAWLSLGREM